MKSEEVLHSQGRKRNILRAMKGGRLTRLVTSCVGTVLKH